MSGKKYTTEKRGYDGVYSSWVLGASCPVSIDSLVKAERLVYGLVSSFGLGGKLNSPNALLDKSVIDIGCGLGFVTEAFRKAGAKALGVDASPVAVDLARKSFPSQTYLCRKFPEELYDLGQFDLVFVRSLTPYNTFDVDLIFANFIRPALSLVSDSGVLVFEGRSDFSGRKVNDWAQWRWSTIREIVKRGQLSGPRVIQMPFELLSAALIILARVTRKNIPFYFLARPS
jgi:SAM-dependent methyltransferase